MSDSEIQVEILTPEKPLASEAAEEVSFPAEDGYMGILPRHTPLVAGLGIGEVTLRQGPNLKRFLVQGGFAQVSPERVVLLADLALLAERIDRAEAEADLKKAAEALSHATMPEEVEAALTLERSARARLEILGRR